LYLRFAEIFDHLRLGVRDVKAMEGARETCGIFLAIGCISGCIAAIDGFVNEM
jgi:hypothetical protein